MFKKRSPRLATWFAVVCFALATFCLLGTQPSDAVFYTTSQWYNIDSHNRWSLVQSVNWNAGTSVYSPWHYGSWWYNYSLPYGAWFSHYLYDGTGGFYDEVVEIRDTNL